MFSFPSLPPFSLKSGSKVSVPFSLLGGMGWPFFACGQVIVWSILFSAFLYWKLDWGSSFSAGAIPLQGFSIAFMPSVGRFRDEGVPICLGSFSLSFYFQGFLSLEGFLFSLCPPGHLFVLSEGVFLQGF